MNIGRGLPWRLARISRKPPSDDELVERVCRLVTRVLNLPPGARPTGPEARLLGGGLGADSLDALRLVAALEEEFDIVIEDEALAPTTFASVGSLVGLVRELRSTR